MSDKPEQSAGDDVPSRFSVDFTGETLLGVYRVEKKLAAGGMGSVYLAEDTNLGRPVVVKVPHPRFLGEPGFRNRFAQEITDLVRLEHPHIVRILARGENDDLSFFVLQYLGGGTLEDRLEAAPDHRQTPAETASWLKTIAATLDYVAERGIVHRDVKPGNILFDEQGHVFLSDFGVAKTLDSDSGITGSGVAIGSPKYMAPEQGLGDKVGSAADQYALASTLFEALSGQAPFTGKNLLTVLLEKSREEPPRIEELVPELPRPAAETILKALSRDPADRFTSSTEFADAFLAGVGATSSWTTLAEEKVEALPPKFPALIPVILLLVIGAVVAGVALLNRGDPKPPPVVAPPVTPPPPLANDPVTLVDAGAAPRRILRYRVEPGLEQAVEMTTTATTEMSMGEQNMKAGGTPMTLRGLLEILEVGEAGVIRYRWKGVMGPAEDEPSTDPMHLFAQKLSGLEAIVVANDRGISDRVEFKDADQLDPIGLKLLESLTEGVRNLATPLPAEPVGLGARWEVTSVVSNMGMRLTQTTAYELIAIDGDQFRISVTLAQTAPPQDLVSEFTPPDAKLRLKSFHSSGEGESTVQLDSLVPLLATSKATMDFAADLESEKESGLVEIHVETDSRIERR